MKFYLERVNGRREGEDSIRLGVGSAMSDVSEHGDAATRRRHSALYFISVRQGGMQLKMHPCQPSQSSIF
jgi:hypothetical protein